MTDSLRVWWKLPEPSDRLTMLVIVGSRSGKHSLRSQVGIGSESYCLLRQLNRILEISDSEAGIKVEKSEGDKIESNSKTLNAKILSINLTDCTIKTQ